MPSPEGTMIGHFLQTTMFPTPTSEGEKARSSSAAMIPTGKKRSAIGGGGSGGRTNGRTTMETATAARTRTDTKLKQRTIVIVGRSAI